MMNAAIISLCRAHLLWARSLGERVEWYEQPWFEDVSQQIFTILTLAIVALGVIRPLLNRILVPVSAGDPGLMVIGEPDDESESVEVSEGESLEDIKAKLKPKKQSHFG